MNLRTHLVLGRVSNLPTVWTNALAGAALSGAMPGPGPMVLLLLALSLFYVGGMYLNDAFDAEIDARERSARPIPSGAISRQTVYALGFGYLGVGAVLGFALSPGAGIAGLALAGAVILYDWSHKHTVLSPVIMGACRMLTYAMAGFAAGGINAALIIGAAGLFAHVVGLTYAAKQEAYDRIGNAWPLAVLAVPALIGAWVASGVLGWLLLAGYLVWGVRCLLRLFRRAPGDVPVAVVGLIAGIALYDAVLIAAVGQPVLALIAVAGFAATLLLQRVAPGT